MLLLTLRSVEGKEAIIRDRKGGASGPHCPPATLSPHNNIEYEHNQTTLWKARRVEFLVTEYSKCLQQSMVKGLSYSSMKKSVLTVIDRILEEALDHLILGMFTSTYTSHNTLLTV